MKKSIIAYVLKVLENPAGLELYTPKLTMRTGRNDHYISTVIAGKGPGMSQEIMQLIYIIKMGSEWTGPVLSITNCIDTCWYFIETFEILPHKPLLRLQERFGEV